MGVIETAKSFVGKVQYSFGASDPEGGRSDCSGFTQYVFRENGYNIGRTTQEQYQKGEEVSKSLVKAGDLVFFKDTYDSNYIDGVSHVGIALGGGVMIDCGSNGVTVRSYETEYWKEHWLGARRISGVEIGNAGNTSISNATFAETIDLKWWGDVVVVIVILLLIIAALWFLIMAVGVDSKIKEVLPT